jgi:uncharacterized protein (TIGR00369 family)
MINAEQFLELFITINKYDIENGLTFEVHSPGHITYRMTIQDKHLSSPNTSHGAALSGFMDCVLGLSSLSEAITKDDLTSTVEFKINFIRPAKLGDELIGTGKVIHRGKSLIISSGEVKNQKGDLIAVGQGTFNTYPASKKDFLNELK